MTSNVTWLSDAQGKTKGDLVVDGYVMDTLIGKGAFGAVYKGIMLPGVVKKQHEPKYHNPKFSTTEETRLKRGKASTVAIKVINIRDKGQNFESLTSEIKILKEVKHNKIVELYSVLLEGNRMYLVMEYCAGSDLRTLINTRKSGSLTEGLTQRLSRDLISGLRFLWENKLIHRDIKPQNLLLTGPLPLEEVNDPCRTEEMTYWRQKINFPSELFALKIVDFGLARYLHSSELAETYCGTPLYMAPEVLKQQRYDSKADLWSFGIVLFQMLAGRTPFDSARSEKELLHMIENVGICFPEDVCISIACKKILSMVLVADPVKRATYDAFCARFQRFIGADGSGPASGATDSDSSQRNGTFPVEETVHIIDAKDARDGEVLSVRGVDINVYEKFSLPRDIKPVHSEMIGCVKMASLEHSSKIHRQQKNGDNPTQSGRTETSGNSAKSKCFAVSSHKIGVVSKEARSGKVMYVGKGPVLRDLYDSNFTCSNVETHDPSNAVAGADNNISVIPNGHRHDTAAKKEVSSTVRRLISAAMLFFLHYISTPVEIQINTNSMLKLDFPRMHGNQLGPCSNDQATLYTGKPLKEAHLNTQPTSTYRPESIKTFVSSLWPYGGANAAANQLLHGRNSANLVQREAATKLEKKIDDLTKEKILLDVSLGEAQAAVARHQKEKVKLEKETKQLQKTLKVESLVSMALHDENKEAKRTINKLIEKKTTLEKKNLHLAEDNFVLGKLLQECLVEIRNLQASNEAWETQKSKKKEAKQERSYPIRLVAATLRILAIFGATLLCCMCCEGWRESSTFFPCSGQSRFKAI